MDPVIITTVSVGVAFIAGLIVGARLSKPGGNDRSGNYSGITGELEKARTDLERERELVRSERAELDAERNRLDRERELNSSERSDIQRDSDLLDELAKRAKQKKDS